MSGTEICEFLHHMSLLVSFSGYAVSFTTLVFVALCEVAWHMFSAKTAYSVNLAAVSLVAMGCTIQQSSFYGFASMLPKQYTQAVMAGESTSFPLWWENLTSS